MHIYFLAAPCTFDVRFTNMFQVKKVVCDWLARLLFMKRPSGARTKRSRLRLHSRLFHKKSTGGVERQGGGGGGSGGAANGGVGVATKATRGPQDSVVVSAVNLETPSSMSRTRTPDSRNRHRQPGTSGPSASGETWPATYDPPTYDPHRPGEAPARDDTHRPGQDPAAAAGASTSNVVEPEDGDTDRLSSAAVSAILYELRLLTGKLVDDEKRLAICSDWKFAAMVVDRFCLILFSVFTVVSTFAILFSAPHVIV